MRLLVRAALVLTLILVLAVGALAVLMPRIVKSDAVRERIETAARDAVGREVRYEDLDFGLFPPSLLVVGPSVAGPTPKHAPLLEAEELALRVALLPLLARTVVVDSLVLERTIDEVMAEHTESVEQYRAGDKKLLNFLMGQVMRRTQGKADPGAVREILTRRLEG